VQNISIVIAIRYIDWQGKSQRFYLAVSHDSEKIRFSELGSTNAEPVLILRATSLAGSWGVCALFGASSRTAFRGRPAHYMSVRHGEIRKGRQVPGKKRQTCTCPHARGAKCDGCKRSGRVRGIWSGRRGGHSRWGDIEQKRGPLHEGRSQPRISVQQAGISQWRSLNNNPRNQATLWMNQSQWLKRKTASRNPGSGSKRREGDVHQGRGFQCERGCYTGQNVGTAMDSGVGAKWSYVLGRGGAGLCQARHE